MLAGNAVPDLTEDTFVPDRTRRVAETACAMTGLDATGAELVRHQTNAVYRLTTAQVMVKVIRPAIRHTKSVVDLVTWLVDHGVPSVGLVEGIGQPLEVAGCSVTLWHYLPQDRPIGAGDIAAPLLALHRVPTPSIALPELDALGAIHRSVLASRIVSAAERGILLRHWARLVELVPGLHYATSPRLIHGDPQHRNTLWDERLGLPVLCDWESAAIGHVEWDLVTIEVHCRRFGFPAAEYDEFCGRYGRDVRDWDGYAALRDLRELRMITTNARKSRPDTPAAAEVRRRIAGLDAGPDEVWSIL